MRKSPRGYNVHHCVPKSKGGTNNPENLKTMLITRHRALHILYENSTPDEQLITNLSINSWVLRWEFRQDIMDIIQDYWEDYLVDGVKKNDRGSG